MQRQRSQPRLIPLFGASKLSFRVKCWKNLLSQTRNRNLFLKIGGFLTSIVKHTAALAAQTTLCLQHRENIVIGYQLTIMNIRGGCISPQQYTGVLSERRAPAMGVLNLVTVPPTASEAFTSEEKFQITAIEIEGNTTIPTEVIQQNIPIQPKDVITLSQLSWLIAELRAYDLFQDVRLEDKTRAIRTRRPSIFFRLPVCISESQKPPWCRHARLGSMGIEVSLRNSSRIGSS